MKKKLIFILFCLSLAYISNVYASSQVFYCNAGFHSDRQPDGSYSYDAWVDLGLETSVGSELSKGLLISPNGSRRLLRFRHDEGRTELQNAYFTDYAQFVQAFSDGEYRLLLKRGQSIITLNYYMEVSFPQYPEIYYPSDNQVDVELNPTILFNQEGDDGWRWMHVWKEDSWEEVFFSDGWNGLTGDTDSIVVTGLEPQTWYVVWINHDHPDHSGNVGYAVRFKTGD